MELKTLYRSSFLCLLLAGSSLIAQVGHRIQEVWKLDLTQVLVRSAGASGGLKVLALRFSPDGGRVAVLVGPRKFGARFRSWLLIIDARHPHLRPLQYETNTKVEDSESWRDPQNFQWLPKGDAIDLGGSIFSLAGENICKMPSGAAFFEPNRALVRDAIDFSYTRNWHTSFSHFLILNAKCQIVGHWQVAEEWYIADVSPERHLVSITEHDLSKPGFPTERYLIIDPLTGKIAQQWPTSVIPAGYAVRFADRGTAICAASDVIDATKTPVRCWDVDTGKMISEASVDGGFPFDTAARDSRMVLSDYNRVRIPFTSEYGDTLKRRVIWDFKSGEELASWRPRWQEYSDHETIPPTEFKEPFKFAISPDGDYVVEGGNGSLQLYELNR